ncbi:hypothetical protein BGZ65_011962, partial [Modicella reniformis]
MVRRNFLRDYFPPPRGFGSQCSSLLPRYQPVLPTFTRTAEPFNRKLFFVWLIVLCVVFAGLHYQPFYQPDVGTQDNGDNCFRVVLVQDVAPKNETCALTPTSPSNDADDVEGTPGWQELGPPQLGSLNQGDLKVFFDFQSLKYGGPSAILRNQEIQGVDNSGCHAKDHDLAAGKIAIIEGDSEDCDLWTAANHAEKVGAQAVLFYSGPAHDGLISSPLLPQTWKHGDPLISIPVLTITRSLGLTLLEHQSEVLLYLTTKNLVETPVEPAGGGDDDDKNDGIPGDGDDDHKND